MRGWQHSSMDNRKSFHLLRFHLAEFGTHFKGSHKMKIIRWPLMSVCISIKDLFVLCSSCARASSVGVRAARRRRDVARAARGEQFSHPVRRGTWLSEERGRRDA
eukprot:2507898-Pleurochrysis_carterae.AAC.1